MPAPWATRLIEDLAFYLHVPAAKRDTSLGLPRDFFFFFNLCRGLQPLDLILDILDRNKDTS